MINLNDSSLVNIFAGSIILSMADPEQYDAWQIEDHQNYAIGAMIPMILGFFYKSARIYYQY